MVEDITERKKAEASLQETYQILQAIVQGAPTGIIAIDLDNNVTMWNPAAENIFGWSKQEVVGKPLPIIPAEEKNEFEMIIRRLHNGEAFTGLEQRRQKRDGTPVDICG